MPQYCLWNKRLFKFWENGGQRIEMNTPITLVIERSHHFRSYLLRKKILIFHYLASPLHSKNHPKFHLLAYEMDDWKMHFAMETKISYQSRSLNTAHNTKLHQQSRSNGTKWILESTYLEYFETRQYNWAIVSNLFRSDCNFKRGLRWFEIYSRLVHWQTKIDYIIWSSV